MFASMKSRSSLILVYLGSKTMSPGQIKGKTCKHSRSYSFDPIMMKLAQNVCLLNLGQVQNWVTWGQKLGHLVRSAENPVNTLAVNI